MIRLILILAAMLLFPLNHVLCEYRHPYDVEAWDIMKHGIYMIWGGIIAVSGLFRPDPRLEKFVMAGIYGMILGEVIPCMIDTYGKDREVHWWDFLFWGLAIYAGLFRFVPAAHKRIALFFINEKTYNYLCQWLK